MKRCYFWLAALTLFPTMAHAFQAVTLGNVAKGVRNEDGVLRFYAAQANPAYDKFGNYAETPSPYVPFESAEKVIALVAPDLTEAHWNWVAVKKWVGQEERYIATLCAHEHAISPRNAMLANCEDSPENPLTYQIIAVLQQIPDPNKEAQWEKVAEPYRITYSLRAEERAQQMAHSPFRVRRDNGEVVLGRWDRFHSDFNQIADTTPAFGIAFSTEENAPLRYEMSQYTAFFAILDGKLKPIFHAKSYQFSATKLQEQNALGEWQYAVGEWYSTFYANPDARIDGFYNLQTDDVDGNEQTFYWHADTQEYTATKPQQ